jgi:hypothetical protein
MAFIIYPGRDRESSKRTKKERKKERQKERKKDEFEQAGKRPSQSPLLFFNNPEAASEFPPQARDKERFAKGYTGYTGSEGEVLQRSRVTGF